MADLQDIMSGAAGGAMAGSVIAPGIGTIVGGGIGAIGSLFGKSAAQQRAQAYHDTMELIDSLRRESEKRRVGELTQGVRTIGRYGASLAASARAGAASRMGALGRTDETESAVLPAEQGAMTSANRNLTGFVSDVNQRYNQEEAGFDQAKLNAQMQFNASPTTPSTGESILAGGSALAQTLQRGSYVDALKNYSDLSRQPSTGSDFNFSKDFNPNLFRDKSYMTTPDYSNRYLVQAGK